MYDSQRKDKPMVGNYLSPQPTYNKTYGKGSEKSMTERNYLTTTNKNFDQSVAKVTYERAINQNHIPTGETNQNKKTEDANATISNRDISGSSRFINTINDPRRCPNGLEINKTSKNLAHKSLSRSPARSSGKYQLNYNAMETLTYTVEEKLDECLERICIMGMENERLNNKVTGLTGKLSQAETMICKLRSQTEIYQKTSTKGTNINESYVEVINTLEREVEKNRVSEIDWTKSVQNNQDLQLMVEKLCSERDTLIQDLSLIKNGTVTNMLNHDTQFEMNKKENKLIEVSNQVRMLATENERLLLMIREKDTRNKSMN